MASTPVHTQRGTKINNISAPEAISAMPAILGSLGPCPRGRQFIGIPIPLPEILCAAPSGVPRTF